MANNLTTAPVLSTPESHSLTEVVPTVQAEALSSLSEEQYKIYYEIDRTVREIKDHKWRRVALQFPDHMLGHSVRVYQMLARGLNQGIQAGTESQPSSKQSTTELDIEGLSLDEPSHPVKLTILADTSYGSCCVDEIAAEHVNADAVVHYGRACLSPTARLPVLHIFTQAELDDDAAVHAFIEAYPDLTTQVILTADIPYSSHIHALFDRLRSQGYSNIFSAEIIHDPSSLLPNRTVPSSVQEKLTSLSDWHVYHIAEPPTALLLTLASKVASIRIFDPKQSSSSLESTTSTLLRRRYALITSLSTRSTWGILINTLSVKSYMHILTHIQRQLADAGKKSYLFVVGKLNPAKIANFAEIGGWVVIGCWESSLIDSKEFYQPILTPFELEIALRGDKNRVWTGEWRGDFERVLARAETEEQTNDTQNGNIDETGKEEEEEYEYDSQEESAPPEFDLRTGKYIAQTRPVRNRMREGPDRNVAGIEDGSAPSKALTKRVNGDVIAVNGVASPAAEFLAQRRTWKGLGSDFEIRYDEDEKDVEGALIEQGRSGIARGYAVGDSVRRT